MVLTMVLHSHWYPMYCTNLIHIPALQYNMGSSITMDDRHIWAHPNDVVITFILCPHDIQDNIFWAHAYDWMSIFNLTYLTFP